MKDRDAQLIYEMWEVSKEKHKRAYEIGYKDGKSGQSIGETSDTWGPVSGSYEQGFRDGKQAANIWPSQAGSENKELGIHADRPGADESLSEFGLRVVEGRDDDGDRYWETWEIKATTKDAIERYGHGAIDWVYQSEMSGSIEEIEQRVVQNLYKHGKPTFSQGHANM